MKSFSVDGRTLVKVLKSHESPKSYLLKVDIETGNDAVQTPEALAKLLYDVARQLDGYGVLNSINHKVIKDENGNQVGSWSLKPQGSQLYA